MGLEPTHPLSVAANFAAGFVGGGAIASDPAQTAYYERAQMAGNRTQAFRDIAAIRRDPNLSLAEKNRRIARIRQRMEEQMQGHARTLSRL